MGWVVVYMMIENGPAGRPMPTFSGIFYRQSLNCRRLREDLGESSVVI